MLQLHHGYASAPDGTNVLVRLEALNYDTGQWDTYGLIAVDGVQLTPNYRQWGDTRALPPWTPDPVYWRGVNDPDPLGFWRLEAQVRAVHLGGPRNGGAHFTFDRGTEATQCLLSNASNPAAAVIECRSSNSPRAAILAECGDVGETCCTTLDSARDPLCFQSVCRAGTCAPCGGRDEECCDATAGFSPTCDEGLTCGTDDAGVRRCFGDVPPSDDECGPDEFLFTATVPQCNCTGWPFEVCFLSFRFCQFCNLLLPPVSCSPGVPSVVPC